ncbi:ESX secretion-associated protein EspG [Mycobacterium camsae]|uniref:ESX secretion-associated protein EspG n=1 Tax=Mycobacterium gordonae TaxID=1778 RepID=UPI001981CCC7|nr:ESX secretion-associated protein EspG [Mycobacterium gordonae]
MQNECKNRTDIGAGVDDVEDSEMTQVPREWVGSIDLVDVAAVYELQGHERPPYPFMPADQGMPSRASVADRFSDGDLRVFRKWVTSYRDADIWLECRVLHSSDDIPDTRVLAHRADQLGFLALQRPREGVVDVYQLSPYDLGPAVASSIEPTGPGSRARIVIPKYENYFAELATDDDEDDDEVSVLLAVRSDRGAAVRVPNSHVASLATIQSRCRPARSWGGRLG